MWCGTRAAYEKCVGHEPVQANRGGVRVIYFVRREHGPSDGQVWLLFIYAKSNLDSIVGSKLKELKDAVEKTFDR